METRKEKKLWAHYKVQSKVTISLGETKKTIVERSQLLEKEVVDLDKKVKEAEAAQYWAEEVERSLRKEVEDLQAALRKPRRMTLLIWPTRSSRKITR